MFESQRLPLQQHSISDQKCPCEANPPVASNYYTVVCIVGHYQSALIVFLLDETEIQCRTSPDALLLNTLQLVTGIQFMQA